MGVIVRVVVGLLYLLIELNLCGIDGLGMLVNLRLMRLRKIWMLVFGGDVFVSIFEANLMISYLKVL